MYQGVGETPSSGPVAATLVGGLVWGAPIFYPLLFVEGGTWPEKVAGMGLLTGALVAFLLLFGILFRKAMGRSASAGSWRALLVAPALWIGLEYAMRVVAVGFSPYLGVTQWQSAFGLAIASYGGVHGVSALVVLVNAALTQVAIYLARSDRVGDERISQTRMSPWKIRSPGRGWLVASGLGVSLLLLSQGFFATWHPLSTGNRGVIERPVVAERPEHAENVVHGVNGGEDSVSGWLAVLVQPGFTPHDYEAAAARGGAGHLELFSRVMNLTRTALDTLKASARTGEKRIVFWPETTLHVDVRGLPGAQEELRRLARDYGVGLVLGLPRVERRGDFLDESTSRPDGVSGGDTGAFSHREYNSAMIVTPAGVFMDPYDKVYVIPIAEAQYTPGSRIEPVYPLGTGERLGPALGIGICSDVIEPRHARMAVLAGATSLHYLAALSRIGRLVHLERAFIAMRAAEHRVYVTQTATTGPTFAVDPYGRRLEGPVEMDGPMVTLHHLPLGGDGPTVYTLWGDWPVALGALVLVGCGLFRRRQFRDVTS